MDTVSQINYFKQSISTVGTISPDIKDEQRLQLLQGIAEALEQITSSPMYPSFLEHSIPIIIKVLNDGDPQFLQEHQGQQVRKQLLEIIHRLPSSEPLRRHVPSIITLMFKLLDIDNEENVLICLKIIIELHKQYRPTFSPEVSFSLP